jgi:PIN domain-containing protein
VTFFLDNNLSKHLAHAMAGFQEDVVHLQDRFSEAARDEEWLSAIGKDGWTLITRDDHIRWKPAELAALKVHGIGAFFLGGKNRSRCDLIQQLVRNWPRIKELSTKTRRPFAFRVPPQGTSFSVLSLG